jgi:chromosome partitioning protein
MKIVSFLGEKGGVGKTTNSHATAHGLSMLGIPAAYILTDKRRDEEPLSDTKRVYTIIDGRTVPQLERAIASARQRESNGVFVIDGGSNRGVVDDLIASVSNAVILPFTADDDSVYVVDKEMQHFTAAWALPSNWVTNRKARQVDAGYIDKVTAKYPSRVLPLAPDTHSVRDLLLNDFSGTLLPAAQRFCRDLARQVSALLDAEKAPSNIVSISDRR